MISSKSAFWKEGRLAAYHNKQSDDLSEGTNIDDVERP